MIRSNKLFLIAVIVGVAAIIAVGAFLYWGNKWEFAPLEKEQETTGRVDDLVDSLEKELDEEFNSLYQEAVEDSEEVLNDSNELESLGESSDNLEL
ncbi:MAG: hypothetical protein A2365_00745 [Candidatus Nealsonbacteria bacterium RIFOXYB1_FULL_40_15]|uniref:Uncharacterized protein n=2 Tax=Candidatus Nealsoniibacteriota TaxID=1817911 RepID=A0A1G2ESW5_9BACT|nr:MAG: hypothetical protein A2365_00745 [Candidatus Nealsonbacteria bacterium RIFOXYB1_FULL_40_15]OGZ28516.1 MAG: hypothetical protein A2562_03435 [Candidatus Nealsonbacteria bacterium RIFOXYD1_FULL_39_11]OGZ28797.1 MAG: hypothetical protein A2427_01930 [Candidatus Nealsonbacteria bacterium RIFOXYC1_FULL_40_7]